MKQYFKSCRDCKPPKRHPGCHGECEEYKASKLAYDEEMEQIRKTKELDRDYTEFKSHVTAKTKRRYGTTPKSWR